MVEMDRLDAMHAFVAVADRRGFAAAARELAISASAATRLVAGLESHLGIRLLHRTTRSVSLTSEGERYLERARRALFVYRHFEIPWLELHGGDEPVHADQVVATLARALGLWSLNPCRIVDRRDDPGDASEASFAYGTLEGHVARGEERFTLRRDPRTDGVEFEIIAFSRPAMLLTRLGRPVLRRVQRRFAPAAAEALARAAQTSRGSPALRSP